MRALLPVAAFAVAMTTPAPALAQAASAKSTSDTVGRQARGVVDGARELRRLAACTYARRPGYFDRLLATPPASGDEGRILNSASNTLVNCMNALAPSIFMSHLQMRGAFAEARYLANNPTPRNFARIEHTMIAIPAHWTERAMNDAERLAIVKYDFANCVVAADPVNSDVLLRSEPLTKGEAQVIGHLIPKLGPCLRAEAKYQLDAPILRALIAQSLDSSTRKWAAAGPMAASGIEN